MSASYALPSPRSVPAVSLMPRASFPAPSLFLLPTSLPDIPAGDSNDGRFPAGEWFFNNDTINMTVADDVTAKVPVGKPGVYHLFVRSIGTAGQLVQRHHRRQGGFWHLWPWRSRLAARRRLRLQARHGRDTADIYCAQAVVECAGADKERGLQGRRSEGAGAAAGGEAAA